MTRKPGGAPPEGDDPFLGTVIAGRYRLVEKLGEGGMGAVYRGVHEALRKPVAVKILPREARRNKELITRFEREAVAAANLKHPGIAEVTDSGQTPDGLLFMVMDFVEGRTLAALLQQEGRLPPARALHLLRQIGAAASFAHGREVVHRDLKPDNVVVFDRGEERDLVKVIDFGIARMRSSFGGGASGLTRAGSVMGTAEYMPPEQGMGQAVDARADQYSLGVIAFEMLTGEPPFVADDVAALVFMHVGAPVPLVSARVPELAAYRGLDEVVARMMGKLPEERFPTVSDAIAALARAVEVPSLTASGAQLPAMAAPVPPGPSLTARGTIITQAVTEPAARLTSQASMPGVFPQGTRSAPAAHGRETSVSPSRRRPVPVVLIAAVAGGTLLILLMALGIYLWSSSPAEPVAVPTASAPSAAPPPPPTDTSMLFPPRPNPGQGPGLHVKGKGRRH
jgi:serine/threonine-protein kinase